MALEAAKFGWFRDYGPARAAFQDLVRSGTDLLGRVRDMRTSREKVLDAEIGDCAGQAARLKDMTGSFNENGAVRRYLAQADIQLAEAGMLVGKGEYEKARLLLEGGRRSVASAQEAAAAVLNRYLDPRQLARWKSWADETILESRSRGITSFIVGKLERKIHIYHRGALAASFDIGLGHFGLSDKMYSGDEATPEGRYMIIKKYPAGPFYKALLIDYPNEEDRQSFARGKRAGTIPNQAGIGGYIEIHGGGKDSLTKGCVGLENKDMEAVYDAAEAGTPVTIVGTLSADHSILAEIRKFKKR